MNYDNPLRAVKIWLEYEPDIMAMCLSERAERIIEECNKCDNLDIKLDEIVSQEKQDRVAKRSLKKQTAETSGSWDNSVKSLEN